MTLFRVSVEAHGRQQTPLAGCLLWVESGALAVIAKKLCFIRLDSRLPQPQQARYSMLHQY